MIWKIKGCLTIAHCVGIVLTIGDCIVVILSDDWFFRRMQ